ncbi:MAG: hypothetical protein HWE22_07845 [Flavobacteriales bacterium]|nr:hypothetical protein [Flavobacteriales bacterium]
MKKIVSILFLFPVMSFAQETAEVSSEEREFALNVIKAIIEHDCDTYYNSIDDSVVLYLRAQDTIVAKTDMERQIKMLCQISIKNDSLNFAYYKKNFEQQFIDTKTLADKEFYRSGEEISTLGGLKFYEIEEGDIFFDGAYHKPRNRMDFILDDAFKFIMRKVNGEYRIILMTN